MGDEIQRCKRCEAELVAGSRCAVCGFDPSASKEAVGDSLAESLDGHILGGYVLSDVLGSGARGAVFLGRPSHASSGADDVAVKVVAHDRSRSHLQDDVLSSARAAVDIKHAGLATLLDAGADLSLGVAFLISEYVPGEDFGRRLETTGPLPSDEVARVGSAVAGALTALHERGALHRDVRPSHIVVGESGAAKLVETGFPPISQFASGHGETAHDPIVGSPTYASPEQVRAPGEATPRSDIYSLGGVLYHLLTGRPPFVADSAVGLLVQHASRKPAPASSVVPSAAQPLVDRQHSTAPSKNGLAL